MSFRQRVSLENNVDLLTVFTLFCIFTVDFSAFGRCWRPIFTDPPNDMLSNQTTVLSSANWNRLTMKTNKFQLIKTDFQLKITSDFLVLKKIKKNRYRKNSNKNRSFCHFLRVFYIYIFFKNLKIYTNTVINTVWLWWLFPRLRIVIIIVIIINHSSNYESDKLWFQVPSDVVSTTPLSHIRHFVYYHIIKHSDRG